MSVNERVQRFRLSIDAMNCSDFDEVISNARSEEILQKTLHKVEGYFDELSEEIKREVKKPSSHKQNVDEDITIERAIGLINNGLQMSHTRHNSVLNIATYFRYMGMELDECISELKAWMAWQDKSYYDCSLEYANSEIERLSNIVYEKGYTLTKAIEEVQISKSEMEKILNIPDKLEKKVAYSMLIHSKRYKTATGVFYMTYNQISESIGISSETARFKVNDLENNSMIEIVSRNVRRKNSHFCMPNKYKLLFEESNIEIDKPTFTLVVNNKNNNYEDVYMRNVCSLFTNKELKGLISTRHQLNEFYKYRKTAM